MPNTKKSKSKSKVLKKMTKRSKVSKKSKTRKIIIARKAPFKKMGKHPKKMVIPLFINPKFIRNGKVDWVAYTK